MHGESPRLPDIVYTVEAGMRTVSICNFDDSSRVQEALSDYFSKQSVKLRHTQTDDRIPKNFAVLHDGEEYLAASELKQLYEAIRADASLNGEIDPDQVEIPDVLSHIPRTEFSSYNKARMVNISRIIERTAWDADGGELHAGFQQLSKVQDQWNLYSQLANSHLDVHLYGAPDWEIPSGEATVHAYDDAEITRTWFVVTDLPNEKSNRALLAEERGPNEFYGFWTDENRIIETILERLRREYPSTTDNT